MKPRRQFWAKLATMLEPNQRAVYVYDNTPDKEPNSAILIFTRDKEGRWHVDPDGINDYFMESLERINVVQKPRSTELTYIKNKWAK